MRRLLISSTFLLMNLTFSSYSYASESNTSEANSLSDKCVLASQNSAPENQMAEKNDSQIIATQTQQTPCQQNNNNDLDDETLPIVVEANQLNAVGQNEAIYTGDVLVTRGHRTMNADTITLDREKDSMLATGKVVLKDGDLESVSTKAQSDLRGDKIELYDTDYKLACQGFRGDAAYILKDGKSIYSMEDGSLTTCPDDNKSWRIKASQIDVDNDKQEATFYSTRFEILDVPVFYWPYITVPIGDQRKTGFLFPMGGYDTNNGLEINIPYYFNLAPNYDLLTTLNYMEKRGVQFDNQFRYLTDGFGASTIDFEYLYSDDLHEDKGSRWGVNWQHNGVYNRHWRFEVDYAKVSDKTYLDDLDSDIGEREDGQLNQTAEVSYRTNYTDTTLRVRDFQTLTTATPYRLMPQLRFEYQQPNIYDQLGVSFDSHISRLTTDNESLPDATRVHLEPGINLPLHNAWGQLTTDAKVMYTYYDQDLKNGSAEYQTGYYGDTIQLKDSTQRVVPKFRINGSLYLDSPDTFLGDYTQTIEPRLQYLYIPEVDQSEIYNGYDTTLMQQDYYGLFRDRQYSSVDYIAPANQLSYGMTSRFYDGDFKERFAVSFGQILYLNSTEYSPDSLSSWALENEWNMSDQWLFKGGLQYNSDFTNIQQAFSTLEYKIPNNGYIQLDYRFTDKNYIELNAPGISKTQLDSYTRDGISQMGALTQFKLDDSWDVRASYYHDATEDNMLESLVGVTYNDDCWFLGLTFSRHMVASGNVNNVYPEPGPEYDSKVSISVGLKGLGKQAGTSYSTGSNALGYGRPFSLN